VVDEIRVLRRLRSITDDLVALRAELSADPGRRADPLWLPGVRYTFVAVVATWVVLPRCLKVGPDRVVRRRIKADADGQDVAVRMFSGHLG
jgi:hypothetical protein